MQVQDGGEMDDSDLIIVCIPVGSKPKPKSEAGPVKKVDFEESVKDSISDAS